MNRELTQYLPFENATFRKHQESTINKILGTFEADVKYAILEAPTGIGKSIIGMTIARYMSDAYIITPQKILQQQYMKDFYEHVVDLKGRSEYYCHLNKKSCAEGACIQSNKSKYETCVPKVEATTCEYYKRIEDAQMSKITLFNFESFVFQVRQDRFKKRKLLIIDEGHNTESKLVNLLTLKFPENLFKKVGITWREDLKTPCDLAEYFDNIEALKLIREFRLSKENKLSYYEDLALGQLSSDIQYLINYADPDNYIMQISETKLTQFSKTKVLELKPIYINDRTDILFSMADHVLIMSATILNSDLLCDNLGISLNERTYIPVPAIFPKENRPVVFKGSGLMNFKEREGTYQNMAKSIVNCMTHHKEQKGIIHTQSFVILTELVKRIKATAPEQAERFLFQKDFPNKDEMLLEHTIRKNSVLIAPALHEGLDLKEDLGRFQIICKIPYPGLHDPWIKARTEKKDGWRYYQWLTALKLVQSYGRIVRSETDEGVTYIFDSQFEKFLSQNRSLLPNWFVEALWEGAA